MKRVAVILSGCGHLDGAEIREAVGVLWALSMYDVRVQCFAPDIAQRDVVDHLQGKPVGEPRNVLVESARIARGNVLPLAQLLPAEFDALIMPGGFGAAKNLCTFAIEGSNGSVLPQLASILTEFNRTGKPIGAACIAPAILALTFKRTQLELTVGAAGNEAKEIEKLGHRHIVTLANTIHIDREHSIVTTPAYMYDDVPLYKIFEGIQQMVYNVLSMTQALS